MATRSNSNKGVDKRKLNVPPRASSDAEDKSDVPWVTSTVDIFSESKKRLAFAPPP